MKLEDLDKEIERCEGIALNILEKRLLKEKGLHVIGECHRCKYWLQETEEGHGLCDLANQNPKQAMGSDTKETYFGFGCIEYKAN